MKKIFVKAGVFAGVFFVSLFVISKLMNQGNTDMTAEMSPATFPTMCMNIGGEKVNLLYGYSQEMEVSYLRDTVTVIPEGRKVSFEIQKYNTPVTGVHYELRSTDGERLIEDGEVQDYVEDEETIQATITLKDLIEDETEYSLTFILDTDVGEIYYYTKVIPAKDYYISEKIAFVKDFHTRTFDKEAAREIAKYLESNAEGDNTTFSKVNIHSSFQQITWGDLDITIAKEPTIAVKEIDEQTGAFQLQYIVYASEGRTKKYYMVEEYYRVRYTTDRMYLLEYDRAMEQIFIEDANVYTNNKISLGIVNSAVQFKESDGGGIFAFVNANRLYSYNVSDNKIALIYSFFDKKNSDERTLHDDNGIRILNVDETGNIRFVVYGYMNRGRHEGGVGIQLCTYNSQMNTIEEEIYIPYTKSWQILQREMEDFAYINGNNIFYIMLDRNLYAVDLNSKTYEILATDLRDESYQISESNARIVWTEGADLYNNKKLNIMDLNSKNVKQIQAESGDVIAPLGFMGEDFIYGLAKKTDIVQDETGQITFPMYKVIIQDELGEVIHTYEPGNAYVVGSEIDENQITLHRVQKNEEGIFVEMQDDQIMSTKETVNGSNYLETVAIEKYEKVVQIVVKNKIDSKTLQILTPKEVLYEGGRLLAIKEHHNTNEFYYVYEKGKIEGIYGNPDSAVNLANEISGVVVNDNGIYVWKKGNRSTKNQIMKIKGTKAEEGQRTLAVCLDTMLGLEGVVRSTQHQLDENEHALDILQSALPDYQILNLTGCTLDATLYYVNKDIPVLATLNDGNAVLIIGFNETQIVVMNPANGLVYKMGMTEASEWFEENGNSFITYVRAMQ